MVDKKKPDEPATGTSTETPAVQKSPENQMTLMQQFGDITGVAERPADVDPNDISGTEGIDPDQIRLPRLAIAQGLSPQMIPMYSSFIRGLVLGDMFNDVTNEIYGAGPLTLVPIGRRVVRIEFDPNDKKVPIDMEVPAGDPRLLWTASNHGGKKDTPPRATEFFEFVCLLLRPGKAPEVIMVSIKATNKYQRKAAKDWLTFISMRGAAIYRGLYTIMSKFEKGKTKKGEDTNFGVFVVKNAGFIPTNLPTGKALVDFAKQQYEHLNGKTIVVGREGGDDTDFDTAAMDATAAPTGGDPGM